MVPKFLEYCNKHNIRSNKVLFLKILLQWLPERGTKISLLEGNFEIDLGNIVKICPYPEGMNLRVLPSKKINGISWQSSEIKGGIILDIYGLYTTQCHFKIKNKKYSFLLSELLSKKKFKFNEELTAILIPKGEGKAYIEPKEVVVGKEKVLKLKYIVGISGIAQGGGIRVLTDTGRTDWNSGNVEVSTTGNAKVIISEHWHIEKNPGKVEWGIPFSTGACDTTIMVAKGNLKEGDEILLVYLQVKTGTISDKQMSIGVLVDTKGYGCFSIIENYPTLTILSEKPESLRVNVPSLVNKKQDINATIMTVDRYGNLVKPSCPDIQARVGGAKEWMGIKSGRKSSTMSISIPGQTAEKQGISRLQVVSSLKKLSGVSNPFQTAKSGQRLFWGDLHVHSILSDATKGPDFIYKMAKRASLDFCAITDHLWGPDYNWLVAQEKAAEYNEPGEFIAILGYESGTLTGKGGDINVYFPRDFMIPHMGTYLRSTGPNKVDSERINESEGSATEMWNALRGTDAITIPHQLWQADASEPYNDFSGIPDMMPVIEIYSEAGPSEAFGPEKILCYYTMGKKTRKTMTRMKKPFYFQDMLKKGFKVGVIAASDTHFSLPGLNHYLYKWRAKRDRSPVFYPPGLTAVYADNLSRKSIFKAIKMRRCYATTGERILLDFNIDSSPMGSEIKVQKRHFPLTLSVEVGGTTRIESIDIVRNCEDVYGKHPSNDSICFDWEINDIMHKSGDCYYIRVKQEDGNMAWSSPIWINL